MADEADTAEDMTLEQRLQRRVDGLCEWLGEVAPECFDEQLHVRGPENGKENVGRVYWHYGYMVAIRDVLGQLQRKAVQH